MKADLILIFFFCWLKLSMMTPMKRLRVKKAPNMMKTTKYKYIFRLISYSGCSSCCDGERQREREKDEGKIWDLRSGSWWQHFSTIYKAQGYVVVINISYNKVFLFVTLAYATKSDFMLHMSHTSTIVGYNLNLYQVVTFFIRLDPVTQQRKEILLYMQLGLPCLESPQQRT